MALTFKEHELGFPFILPVFSFGSDSATLGNLNETTPPHFFFYRFPQARPASGGSCRSLGHFRPPVQLRRPVYELVFGVFPDDLICVIDFGRGPLLEVGAPFFSFSRLWRR